MSIGVKALGPHPLKTDKRGEGQRDIPVRFGGVTFRPGDWLYADEDGVIVARRQLIDVANSKDLSGTRGRRV